MPPSNPPLTLEQVFRRERSVTAENECLVGAVLDIASTHSEVYRPKTRDSDANHKTTKKGLNGLLTKEESQEHNRQNIQLA